MTALLETPLPCRLAALFAIGVCLGSAANLLAYVLSTQPGRSPWSRSHPFDGRRRWLDRLPIVGAWRLRRQSERLGRGFWLRPLLAELGMGAFCAAAYWWEIGLGRLLPPGIVAVGGEIAPSPLTWQIMHAVFLAQLALCFFMLAATLIDFDERIIPDEITVPGTLIGLMLAAGYAWTLMPVHVQVAPPGIQFVEFITLVYPGRIYPQEWPAYLEAPKQLLPLLAALAVYGFWCVSLLPWLWLPGRGLEKSVRMFLAHAVRAANFPFVLTIGLCGAAGILMVWWSGGPGWAGLLTALAGMAMGGGMIWAVRIIFSAILQKEAMGFGDVTLLAMIGAYLGWQAPIFIFFLAPCIGIFAYGLVQLPFRMGREIPYGPYLCLASVIVILAWRWFWKVFPEYFQPIGELPIPLILGVLFFCAVVGCIMAFVCQAYRWARERLSAAK